MSIPKPGTKLKNSRTGRPIMAALEILGRRWALRVLWELHKNSPCSFRALQKLCGDISPTVLNVRLSELREAGIISLREKEGYVITDEGVELGAILLQLDAWAKRWAARISAHERDGADGEKTNSNRAKNRT
ncbi:MAG TPA: helix-turn-helix domain-containing protein [Spirochaetota bacterium]|nr:helix-turn-helix domain-containing protein [Spirochaetota bacterium]HNT12977.1 helix-turn-helix domain-containing protein [Spirochaetota bacterium]